VQDFGVMKRSVRVRPALQAAKVSDARRGRSLLRRSSDVHGVSEIMIPFLAMHALAAPRGDGLRPELLALFERHEAASNPHRVVAVFDQHRADAADAAEAANPRPMSGKVAA
jgi:hypothetical protein